MAEINVTNWNAPITFIGAGNIAQAVLGGLLRAGIDEHYFRIVATRQRMLPCAMTQLPVTTDYVSAVTDAHYIVLAVKPALAHTVASRVASVLSSTHNTPPVVISFIAGITLSQLQEWLPLPTALVRVMPNIAAQICQSTSVVMANNVLDERKKQHLETLLSAIGRSYWVSDEMQVDLATALSGSGPAYFFWLAEVLRDAAVANGLPHSLAEQLIVQTVFGAATLARNSEMDLGTLRRNVTSVRGTTEHAIQYLEEGNGRNLFAEALTRAYRRARQFSTS